MDEYINLDKSITVADTRGIEHETTVRHILDMNKGMYEADDVRPVVLCRDCKSYRQSSFVDNHMECARSGCPVRSVDFCSFGEKREES